MSQDKAVNLTSLAEGTPGPNPASLLLAMTRVRAWGNTELLASRKCHTCVSKKPHAGSSRDVPGADEGAAKSLEQDVRCPRHFQDEAEGEAWTPRWPDLEVTQHKSLPRHSCPAFVGS